MWRLLQVLISVSVTSAGSDSLTVTTRKGQVRGETQYSDLGKPVDVWASIPFAKPPLGALRFRHPQPMEPWPGVKDVTGKANSCVQIDGVVFPGFSGEEIWLPNTRVSEDCLYLQVAVPQPRRKKIPVMVRQACITRPVLRSLDFCCSRGGRGLPFF